MPASTPNDVAAASEAWIVIPVRDEGGSSRARVWGLSATERLQRSLPRCGVGVVRIDSDGITDVPLATGERLLIRGDYFYDERLVQGLVDGSERILVDANDAKDEFGTAVAVRLSAAADAASTTAAMRFLAHGGEGAAPQELEKLPRASATDVAPAYNRTLRKHDPPFLLAVRPETEPSAQRDIENRIFASSYKGVTDLVTKWLFPWPARAVTRQLAQRGVKPNSVTAVSYLMTALAALLFYEGAFAAGLAAAWLMTFLDTVDGKLARVTLTSTPFGNVLDHGLDLVHPPIWWAAWAYGMAPASGEVDSVAWVAMWIIVVGYVVGRLLEGVFLLAFKQEIFTWQRFDGFFRTIIARRNPNLLLLTLGVAMAAPLAGYIAVASWTVACIAIQCVRIGQAFATVRRGGEIRPWYETDESLGGAAPGSRA
jgi:phosphatidylglycerophosphate synthase